jgi:hypothetical protein
MATADLRRIVRWTSFGDLDPTRLLKWVVAWAFRLQDGLAPDEALAMAGLAAAKQAP